MTSQSHQLNTRTRTKCRAPYTLVDAAVGAGATHATLALIEAKADLDKQTKIGNTALILACQNGHEQCALWHC